MTEKEKSETKNVSDCFVSTYVKKQQQLLGKL